MTCASARDLIERLDLSPHPEGGYFRETFRDDDDSAEASSASTAIYYLLEEGDRSHWHRVLGSSEVWHFYDGDPLELSLSDDAKSRDVRILGRDFDRGERPQIVVPSNVWQSARSLGAWTLVGCTVAPGFSFENFEMAPSGWEPG